MMDLKGYDRHVWNYFVRLLERGADGHDFLEDVTCGKYKGNNRAARIARLAWWSNARFQEPYFQNVLAKLTNHVMKFYKVDPGDSDIMRNVLVEG